MFKLDQEISTPIGVVILVSFALLAGIVMISQTIETMKESCNLEKRLLLENK